MTSSNGINWTSQTSAADNSWKSVTYGNSLFVAVSLSGTVMTSPDGITWTLRSSASNNAWSSLTYGNGLFVAVSLSGTVMTSPNGINWTSRTSAANNSWRSVTYGNGLFVAVAESGTGNRVMTATVFTIPKQFYGASPFQITTPTSNSTGSFSYRSSDDTIASISGSTVTFVGLGTATITATQAATDTFTEGTVTTTLTVKLNPTITPLSSIPTKVYGDPPFDIEAPTSYSPGLFSYASSNTRVATISGSTVTIVGPGSVTITATQEETQNYYGGTVSTTFVVKGPPTILSQWTSRTSAADNWWNSVTYGNGLFVAVSQTGPGNRVMTSPDGITWTSRTSAANNDWNSVTYGNGLFVAVSDSGTVATRVMTSSDGITWESRTSASDNWWSSVTYGNGLFVAVSTNLTGNRVMTSPDGINWESRTSVVNSSWTSVTYGNGLFVAVAYGGTGNRVMTSPDGITWTSQTSAANNSWSSVTYGNGLFVAVAGSGTNRVMTSPDGITWTSRNSTADNQWYSVTYGNGLFVAIANFGTGNMVMTSPDGITWTSRTSASDNSWYGVTYGAGKFVAVAISGSGNRVMTATDFTIPTQSYGASPFQITAPTSNSTGSFSYESLNEGVATISGSTVTIVGVGTATIRATQAPTDTFTQGTTSTILTVNQANPNIRNFVVPSKILGNIPFVLEPPARYGNGAISYRSSNERVATVNVNTGLVTIIKAGETTITASLAANANYLSGTIDGLLRVNNATAENPPEVSTPEEFAYILSTDAAFVSLTDSIIVTSELTSPSKKTLVTYDNNIRITKATIG